MKKLILVALIAFSMSWAVAVPGGLYCYSLRFCKGGGGCLEGGSLTNCEITCVNGGSVTCLEDIEP